VDIPADIADPSRSSGTGHGFSLGWIWVTRTA
jgi:hypothetical protein